MATDAMRVEGKAEPIPRGAIAKKKIIAPKHAERTIRPFSMSPIAINPCPIEIIETIGIICNLNHPLIKLEYRLKGVSAA
tara:strand:- start:46897 stop:47136 length:240 start_codon:yes stop_codon:yes gene_type:complete